MGANERYPSGPHPSSPVQANTLRQIEPDYGDEFIARPFSLTEEELGRLPVTMATEPIPVLAWVRLPALSTHVQGRAVGWTPRAVYVEWEHRGLHRGVGVGLSRRARRTGTLTAAVDHPRHQRGTGRIGVPGWFLHRLPTFNS